MTVRSPNSIKVVAFYSLLYIAFFSPVIFSHRLLAPSDALSLYLPSFLSPFELWDPDVQNGFPVAADLQNAMWYPIARFFASFGWWNAFVISAYVLLSCFTYAYIYYHTRSWIGALISGIAAGMSGFMMAHLCHTIIIHGMAWIPLILLSIDHLHSGFNKKWFAVGAFAVAFSLLAGHPQIPVYGLIVAGFYALVIGKNANQSSYRFLINCAAMVLIGFFLTAIQTLPLFELISESTRKKPEYSFFATHSMRPSHLVTLLFPSLFGTYDTGVYQYSYFGPWNLIERTGYIGIITILLGIVAIQKFKLRKLIWFWSAVALVALLLALGRYTPLSHLIYLIPVLNHFRVPARHFSEMILALCFLAGFGTAAIHDGSVARKNILIAIIAALLLFGAAALTIKWNLDSILEMAAYHDVTNVMFAPWRNFAVAIPLILLIAGSSALILYYRNRSRSAAGFLVLVSILDLASFGFFAQWRIVPDKNVVHLPAALAPVRQRLRKTRQRIYPEEGVWAEPEHAAPNLTRLWDLPNGSGYGSIVMERLNKLLSIGPEGALHGDWAKTHNKSLDVMAVRYVVVRHQAESQQTGSDSPRWKIMGRFNGFSILENRNAMPRAWLVSRTIPLKDEDVRQTILDSQLPDGSRFRPAEMALVEEQLQLNGAEDPDAAVEIVEIRGSKVEINVRTTQPSFLVISDLHYPGWKATVNHQASHIYRTNYLFRGIMVPTGSSSVRLSYEPVSFLYGLAVTLAALAILIAILVKGRKTVQPPAIP